MAKEIDEGHKDWDIVLDAIVAQYNATTNRSTGFSPNVLFTGREALTPLDLQLERAGVNKEADVSRPSNPDLYVDRLHARLKKIYDSARRNSSSAAAKRKSSYDRGVRRVTYNPFESRPTGFAAKGAVPARAVQ